MSKNCIISLIIGCFVYSLLSCSESYPYCEDEYDKTWISVYPSSITIDEDELEGSFSVYSNRKWTIYSEPYWLYLSSYSGNGNKSIDFTVSENTGYSNRSGNILIRTDDGAIKEQSIHITQAPSNTTSSLEISISNTYFFGNKNDSETLTITTSSSRYWTVSADEYWVSFSKTSGHGSSTVTVYTTANPYSYERYATITVKAGAITRTKVIRQGSK